MNYKKIYNDFIKDRKAKEPEYLKGLRLSKNSKKFVLRGKDNPNAVKVKNLDLNKIYDSVTDAARDLSLPNCARFKIGEVCRGNRKRTGGYRWAYA